MSGELPIVESISDSAKSPILSGQVNGLLWNTHRTILIPRLVDMPVTWKLHDVSEENKSAVGTHTTLTLLEFSVLYDTFRLHATALSKPKHVSP